MKQQCVLGIGFVLGFVFPASPAGAGIVNPSFETGDLSGWLGSNLGAIAGAESESGASDGNYCFSATDHPDPHPLDPVPGSGEVFNWNAGLMQVFDLRVWENILSVDIRSDPNCWAIITLVEMGESGPIGPVIDILAGTNSPAPTGFTRYVADISSLAGHNVRLEIDLSGPDGTPDKISVDNVMIVPEPAMLSLLCGGGVGIVLKNKRRFPEGGTIGGSKAKVGSRVFRTERS